MNIIEAFITVGYHSKNLFSINGFYLIDKTSPETGLVFMFIKNLLCFTPTGFKTKNSNI